MPLTHIVSHIICARRNRGALSDGDVLLKINLVSGDDKTYTIRKISPLTADSLPSLEIVQITSTQNTIMLMYCRLLL